MQGQPQITTPEAQQLVAHLIQKGPDALHTGKPVVTTSPAGTSAATGMAKPIPLVSTTAQLQLKMATQLQQSH